MYEDYSADIDISYESFKLFLLKKSEIDNFGNLAYIESRIIEDCLCENCKYWKLRRDDFMDKKIRKIEKGVKKSEKELKQLETADKKRDKLVDKGRKAMKGKC